MCNFGEAILEQGIEQGEQRVNRLIQLLLKDSRGDEIPKAVSDPQYQKKLYKEFGL